MSPIFSLLDKEDKVNPLGFMPFPKSQICQHVVFSINMLNGRLIMNLMNKEIT